MTARLVLFGSTTRMRGRSSLDGWEMRTSIPRGLNENG
jgi:hypothetical protein